MTIPVGNKAQGVDFFDRIRERESMWELIENTNILFSGPRRLGKTSILAQLEKDASSHEWFAQLIDVQGISTVAEFLAKIEAAFPESGLNAWLAEARKSGSAIADRLKKLEIKLPGGAGAGVELQAAASDWGEAAAQLQARLSECTAIIMVDEFSVFLEKLLKHDQADAVRLLGWLRTWRLAKGVRCRFIFSGSIGLNALVARYGCTSYLNDCYDFRLGPFKPDAAHAMLAALTEREGRQANPSLFAHMCAKVGWLSPYYLNLLLLETMRAARTGKTNPRAPPVKNATNIVANA